MILNRLPFCLLLLMGLMGNLTQALAQDNLVPNAGFEENVGLPTEIGQFRLARPWITMAPGNQPADYFIRAAKARTGVPRNFIGVQEPKAGDAYGGFLLYLNSKEEYSEFVQVTLIEPLLANTDYYAELYVSLAEDSEFAVDGLGMHFSANPPLVMQGGYALLQPQISNPAKNIIRDKSNWIKVSGTFRATGGERFLTIGNFKPRKQNAVKKVKTDRQEKEPYKYAYYYFDEVKVVPVNPTPLAANTYFGTLETEKPVVLQHIQFEVDRATLLPQSLPELDRLYDLLQSRPALRILLEGHTDNTNTPGYNQKLSEARAKAVKDYLTGKGIAADRIQTKGYGATRPVAENTTEAGKQQNRRVEFSILP